MWPLILSRSSANAMEFLKMFMTGYRHTKRWKPNCSPSVINLYSKSSQVRCTAGLRSWTFAISLPHCRDKFIMSSTNIIFNHNVMRMMVKSIQTVNQTRRMNSLNRHWYVSSNSPCGWCQTKWNLYWFMWLKSCGRQHLIDHSSIVGHGINIKPSSTMWLLGVYIDEGMFWSTQKM